MKNLYLILVLAAIALLSSCTQSNDPEAIKQI
jgi:outer membrane lipoprotein-sorting protein